VNTLDEIVAAILAFGDKGALRTALKDKAKVDIYQPIFNEGHGVATAEHTTEKTTLEGKVTAAEAAKVAAEQKLAEWKTANPEPAKVIEKYDAELRTQAEKHAAELADRDRKDQEKDRASAVKTLKATLIAKGVKEIHANAIVKDDALLNRIKPYNGSVRVLQKDKDIAIAESDLDKALAALADEVIPTLDAEQLVSKVGRGSGRGTTTGDAGNTGKTTAADESVAEVRAKYGKDDSDGESPRAPAHRKKGDAKQRLNERVGLRSR
jgi:hypothetical protein